MNQFTYKGPDVSLLMSKLRIKILPKYRRMKQPEGPEGRLKMMQHVVNGVIKYERLEMSYTRADEARGYVERLISDAIKYGDTDQRMMDEANYWLREKQLIHKLFKVLVPRFVNCPTAYTSLFKAPLKYPDSWKARCVIELKGNPYPPLVFNGARNKNLIHNVLLDEARKEHRKEKYAEIAKKVALSEKERKEMAENSQNEEDKSKAVQEVSESEQLLKSVPIQSNELLSEEISTSSSENENNPVPVT